ncbi:hypothetical protein Poli38472_002286 [Pythium oligandrum]|uniref:WW domain-containing protein n=1 Tax=Pythium oligandrum TaxID=41045 RepID=A0A8K1FGZ9_PYTOL|nr:hypothetical protein Poli38472_002286 [Pythium oligandrum]|eukprot:TMW63345.1 hypothetical protein Poli38472_002286 [Pythium oligandrum]
MASELQKDQPEHGVAYPEWPEGLGDPRLHQLDNGGREKQSRSDIIARFRAQRPALHAPVSGKQQIRDVRTLQETKFPQKVCSFSICCHKEHATKKCQQCSKFDPARLGYYCDACFEARHPSYRLPHVWIPIEDEVNVEQNWVNHVTQHKLEQDTAELQLLLNQTQSFLQSKRGHSTAVSSYRTPRGSVDFKRAKANASAISTTLRDLMEQIHTELAKKPLTREDALIKIQTMWRIRKARKQLNELLRSIYQTFEDPTTGQTYYYNVRTKSTQWHKPTGLVQDTVATPSGSHNQEDDQEEAERRKVSRKSNKFEASLSDDERRELAARCIQGMLRTHMARKHLCRLISSVYEKIWDENSKRFYYHNTRTKQVNWEKPRWVNDADLLTPRTRTKLVEAEEEAHHKQKLLELKSLLTDDEAARMVQRAYRRRRGFAMLLNLCRSVYERIYDPDQQAYYYHNTRTKEVTWEKPRLLRNAAADVFSPRTRQQQLSSLWKPADQNKKRVEWTEESAAIRLQGLFRARQAKQELDARLAEAYKKVWDPSSEQFYYANLKTGAVSWDRPAILVRRGKLDVEELH